MELSGRIGDYEIVKHIGSGAMGDVYQATDAGMFGRMVAIKLLSEKLTGSETAHERFNREIEVATRLEHENIVTIYGRGVHEGRQYFVMEFIDGEDLHSLIRKPESRTIEEKLDIARQICEALEFAHSHGVVHRDIKPSNIMIARRANRDQVKLLDFGIVHIKRSNLTRVTTQPGTYSYMSPEQVRNSDLDYRSDLFSLGIVLYELFTGVHPFASSSEVRIAARIDQDEPEPPRTSAPDLPSQLDTVLLRLLEKDPAQRPQSAGDVAEALRVVIRRITRGAVSDHSDITNLDEMTQGMVKNLLTWGRQREVEGNLEEALRTYQTATQLAPDSELIKGKVSKLKHRIEIDKKLRGLLTQATAAVASGRVGEARSLWNDAWLLAPDAEEVVELEATIRKAEVASPVDQERANFVDSGIREAESALDRGDLSAAFSKLRDIRTRYPDEDRAAQLWNLVVMIRTRQIPYQQFRETYKAAQAAVADRRFVAAREHLAALKELWPDATEVAALDSEIAETFGSAVRGLIAEAEGLIREALDAALDPDLGIASLGAAMERLDRARELGADDEWIAEPRSRAGALRERLVGVAAALKSALSRARELLRRAEASMEQHDRDVRQVIAQFVEARGAFELVLASAPAQAEANQSFARIDAAVKILEAESKREEAIARLNTDAMIRAEEAVAQALPLADGTDADIERCLECLDSAKTALDDVLGRSPAHGKARELREEVSRRIDQVQVVKQTRDDLRATQVARMALQIEEGMRDGRAALGRIQAMPAESIKELRAALELVQDAETSFRSVLTADPGHVEAQRLQEELVGIHQDLAVDLERKEIIFREHIVEGRSRLPELAKIDSMDDAAIQDALIWLEAAREPIEDALEVDPENRDAQELARLLADGLARANKRKLILEKPVAAPQPQPSPQPPRPKQAESPPTPVPIEGPKEDVGAARVSALIVAARARYDEATPLEKKLESQADRIVELLDPARKGLEEALRLKPGHQEAAALRDQIVRLLKTAKPKEHEARVQRTRNEFRAEIEKALALVVAGQKRLAKEAYAELDRRGRAYEELHPLLPELVPLANAINASRAIPWAKIAVASAGLVGAAIVAYLVFRPPPNDTRWQLIQKALEPPTPIATMSEPQVKSFLSSIQGAENRASNLAADDPHKRDLLTRVTELKQECDERLVQLVVLSLPSSNEISAMSKEQLPAAEGRMETARARIEELKSSKSYPTWVAEISDRTTAWQARRDELNTPPPPPPISTPIPTADSNEEVLANLRRAGQLIPAHGVGSFRDDEISTVETDLKNAQEYLDEANRLDHGNAQAKVLQKRLDKVSAEVKSRKVQLDLRDIRKSAEALIKQAEDAKSNPTEALRFLKDADATVKPALVLYPKDPALAAFKSRIDGLRDELTKPEVNVVNGLTGKLCDPVTRKLWPMGEFVAQRLPDKAPFPGRADASGRYSISLEPGRYLFTVTDSQGKNFSANPPVILHDAEKKVYTPFQCE